MWKHVGLSTDWSSRRDSNPRPTRWQRVALAKLSYYCMERVRRVELRYPTWKDGASPPMLHSRAYSIVKWRTSVMIRASQPCQGRVRPNARSPCVLSGAGENRTLLSLLARETRQPWNMLPQVGGGPKPPHPVPTGSLHFPVGDRTSGIACGCPLGSPSSVRQVGSGGGN